MANDHYVLDMLPSLTLEQAEAVENYVRSVDEELAAVVTLNERLQAQLDGLNRALSLANIKLGGIAMLLQGK